MKYCLSCLMFLLTTSTSYAEKYTCTQIRAALDMFGPERLISIAQARGATREQIQAVIAKCRLNK